VLPGTALRASGCNLAYLVERNDSVIIVLKIKEQAQPNSISIELVVSRKKESRR
jgi:hypothetical protein